MRVLKSITKYIFILNTQSQVIIIVMQEKVKLVVKLWWRKNCVHFERASLRILALQILTLKFEEMCLFRFILELVHKWRHIPVRRGSMILLQHYYNTIIQICSFFQKLKSFPMSILSPLFYSILYFISLLNFTFELDTKELSNFKFQIS